MNIRIHAKGLAIGRLDYDHIQVDLEGVSRQDLLSMVTEKLTLLEILSEYDDEIDFIEKQLEEVKRRNRWKEHSGLDT